MSTPFLRWANKWGLGTALLVIASNMPLTTRAAASPLYAPAGFVTTRGTAFALDGAPFYFQGTNAARFGTNSAESEADIYQAMRVYASKGIRVVRLWGFSCKGAHWGEPIIEWASTSGIGYNESGFRRLDATLDAARAAGLKIILPLVNFEPEYCGIDWWTKQVIGSSDRQQFYTDGRVQSAFRSYVQTLLSRINTRYESTLGRRLSYRDDPTIMAIEVMNEPHTQDYYELNRGLPPGEIVFQFLSSIAAYIRSLDPNHLICSGEEGYKTTTDATLDTFDHNWINNGSKGVNFEKNLTIRHLDFATVHVYPDNWNIPSSQFEWINPHFVQRRAALAHRAGKPIVMEEAGFSNDGNWHPQLGYYQSPAWYLSRMYDFANSADFAGTIIWQAMPVGFKIGAYDYDFNHPVGDVVVRQAAYMNARSNFSTPSSPDLSNGVFVACAGGSASDPDGDGWGWENGRSCRVQDVPRCSNRASDPDGDGWGWENGRSCKV